MRPSVTIGSENTTRISLAWASESSGPSGPTLTTRSGACCAASPVAASNSVQTQTGTDPERVIGTLSSTNRRGGFATLSVVLDTGYRSSA